jgi:prepilin-type N-terminal cleavage/methylation domain-containing protein
MAKKEIKINRRTPALPPGLGLFLALCSKGYSLVEVMIVVMIMGILAMTAFPAVNTWTLDRRLSLSCQTMVSGIEYAASLSNRYQRPFEFTVSTADNRFEIVDTVPYPDSAPSDRQFNAPPVNADGVVQNPFTKQWYLIDFDVTPGLENVKLLSGPDVLSFDATGCAPLTDSTYVVAAGGQTKTIRVSGISGRISIE